MWGDVALVLLSVFLSAGFAGLVLRSDMKHQRALADDAKQEARQAEERSRRAATELADQAREASDASARRAEESATAAARRAEAVAAGAALVGRGLSIQLILASAREARGWTGKSAMMTASVALADAAARLIELAERLRHVDDLELATAAIAVRDRAGTLSETFSFEGPDAAAEDALNEAVIALRTLIDERSGTTVPRA
ncbi:MAG TPA: hypothetical protein VF228_04560 [Iamia sp.]